MKQNNKEENIMASSMPPLVSNAAMATAAFASWEGQAYGKDWHDCGLYRRTMHRGGRSHGHQVRTPCLNS
ncbi:hypothetical protein L484_003440 [Morus notabilis]|uniref:Uncharacterized protein n=1 Tax=Morus notabilis TaxID=981085 RepID=W9RG91_9ROSA|nr:hypothetical protein L484_003440 [Morus notabilis]